MKTNLTGNELEQAMRATSNSSMPRPVIRCGQLPDFDDADLVAVRTAFAAATPCAMGQEWRAELEPVFAPGEVRMGWRLDELRVFAELTDRDIFSHATGDNQRMWELGDTFEMFLRPSWQNEYFELHVTPNNHRLQLRIPSFEALRQAQTAGEFGAFHLPANSFHSRTWVQPENQKWFVFAAAPVRMLCGQARLIPGTRWHFSYSRYDYTKGNPEPVISSTSPHSIANFHRQHEWGELQFASVGGMAKLALDQKTMLPVPPYAQAGIPAPDGRINPQPSA
jgi:hypothetical protein